MAKRFAFERTLASENEETRPNTHTRCASHASERKRSGRTYGRTDGPTDGRTDLRTDGPTDGRTYGRMDGPTDGPTDRRTPPLIEMLGASKEKNKTRREM